MVVAIREQGLDQRTTPLPNAQSCPAPTSCTNTLFEITTNPERLRRAVAFVDAGLASGSFTPVVDRTFDVADIAEGHRYAAANGRGRQDRRHRHPRLRDGVNRTVRQEGARTTELSATGRACSSTPSDGRSANQSRSTRTTLAGRRST
ncbi:hypothetical protein [Streptomyces sp. NPDC058272]|uniref:hypothetical protein n=1 Tax=Streptomyces sp. NPDC058272 TaxID=3346415 RepID=UPI0036F0BD34